MNDVISPDLLKEVNSTNTVYNRIIQGIHNETEKIFE